MNEEQYEQCLFMITGRKLRRRGAIKGLPRLYHWESNLPLEVKVDNLLSSWINKQYTEYKKKGVKKK